jgi:hypothetical protein
MEIPLDKFNRYNFHSWKVIQMHLMSKKLWEIVKGTDANSIIGLALSNLELHHVDL